MIHSPRIVRQVEAIGFHLLVVQSLIAISAKTIKIPRTLSTHMEGHRRKAAEPLAKLVSILRYIPLQNKPQLWIVMMALIIIIHRPWRRANRNVARLAPNICG